MNIIEEIRSRFRAMNLGNLGLIIAFLAFISTAYQGWSTRQTTQASLRAYVTVKNAAFVTSDKPALKGGFSTHLVTVFEDVGSTPFYRGALNMTPHFSQGALPDDFKYPETESSDETLSASKRAMFGPHIPFASQIGTTPEDLSKYRAGPFTLYVYGHISYDDIFNERHTTLYCFRYRSAEDYFELCGQHNKEYKGDYRPE